MEVNDDLINTLSNLACLEFNDREKDEIKQDLERMIGFVQKLRELDTTGIAPLLHMGDEINVLREDRIQGTSERAEALRNAPSTDGIYFKVPKVIRNPMGDQ